MQDNHHFVPQFYLRRFAATPRQIGLFHLPTGRTVDRAPIRSQAYRRHLYGTTTHTEHALSRLEARLAQEFRTIDQTNTAPRPRTASFHALMMFLAAQHGRTTYAADQLNDMLDNASKNLLAHKLPDTMTRADLDNVRIEFTEPGRAALTMILEFYPMLLDLDCTLVENQTRTGLITSDNPVVFYNQYTEERTWVSNTGLQSVGLQVFLPISPQRLLLCYDRHVYATTPTGPHVPVTNREDVAMLNRLQYLSADTTVYLNTTTNDGGEVAAGYRGIQRFRRHVRANLTVQPLPPPGPNQGSELVISYREDIRCNLDLSFLRVRRKARRHRALALAEPRFRVPSMMEAYEDYRRLQEGGLRIPGRFPEFLREFARRNAGSPVAGTSGRYE